MFHQTSKPTAKKKPSQAQPIKGLEAPKLKKGPPSEGAFQTQPPDSGMGAIARLICGC